MKRSRVFFSPKTTYIKTNIKRCYVKIAFIFFITVLISSSHLTINAVAQTPICGNGLCEQGETLQICPSDCMESLTFLSTEGQRIINEKGHYVDLRGFHFDCFSIFPKEIFDKIQSAGDNPYQANIDFSLKYCTDEDIKQIKELGANVVKIGFRWLDIDSSSPSIALGHLDNIIDRFGRNGIYVILQLITARQNQAARNEEPEDVPSLWEDSISKEFVFNLWETIAARYKDNPYIAGYNILQQPVPPDKASLHEFYDKVIGRIRNTVQDQNHILFLEAGAGDDPNIGCGGDYEYENISFSLHKPEYLPEYLCDPNYKDLVCNARHYKKIKGFYVGILTLPEMQDKPLLVGGLYAEMWSEVKKGLFTTYISANSIFKIHHINYTLYSYKSVISMEEDSNFIDDTYAYQRFNDGGAIF